MQIDENIPESSETTSIPPTLSSTAAGSGSTTGGGSSATGGSSSGSSMGSSSGSSGALAGNGHDGREDDSETSQQSEQDESGVAREFQNILDDIQDLLAEAASLTGRDLTRVGSKIGDRLASARDSAREFGGAVTQRARDTAQTTHHYVQENPWAAVAIGAGMGAATGFVVGCMTARRS